MRYANDIRWVTPTPTIAAMLERSDMVKFRGVVSTIVDLRYDGNGELYLVLAGGDEVHYRQVNVIEGHFVGSARRALPSTG